MNRRPTILAMIAFGVGALAVPLASPAQQRGRVWRIGFLSLRRVSSGESDTYGEFFREMRALGYIEGKNLVTELRSAEGKAERLPDLAADLVRLKLDLIVAAGTASTSAAQKATAQIPIVFANANDPIGSGFVKSLARPGGNITGISNFTGDLGPKQLELLRDMVPGLSRVAVLLNPTNSAHAAILKSIEAAAQTRPVRILALSASSPQAIENAFLSANREQAGAVIVMADALFNEERRQIAQLALKYRLASISTFREVAEDGILLTYGPKFVVALRRAAAYVDKIFKGATPGELPVEQPTTFELVINLKTAKALAITVPQSLLLRADELIK